MGVRVEGISSLVLLATVHRCVSLDPGTICLHFAPPRYCVCLPTSAFLPSFSAPLLFFSRGASSLGALQLFPLDSYFDLSRSFARVPSDLLARFVSISSNEVADSGSNGVSAAKPKHLPFLPVFPPSCPFLLGDVAPRLPESPPFSVALLPSLLRPFLFCLPRSGK